MEKNLDSKGRWRNKIVAFRVSPEEAEQIDACVRLSGLSKQRQVIMVTHNPQFIVNLDVDNVIYLSKVDGKFTIQSGALEYENTQYSVLKIVADNIEGGLQTIQGRMKRYEKNI